MQFLVINAPLCLWRQEKQGACLLPGLAEEQNPPQWPWSGEEARLDHCGGDGGLCALQSGWVTEDGSLSPQSFQLLIESHKCIWQSELFIPSFWCRTALWLFCLVKYERIKFLVIALKNAVEVYAWAPKPYHKFMAFKVSLLFPLSWISSSSSINQKSIQV